MEREEDFGKDKDVELNIPNAIVIDGILSRLPVKSIYKFRAVCKLWDSLPYDSKFVELYNRRSASTSTLIILSYKAEGEQSILSFYSFDMSENGNTSKLMSTTVLELDLYSMEPSCSGLICFSSLVGHDIYVCNPSTHELLKLPEVHAVDTRVSSPCRVAGFGFDESSRKYKVVCAHQELGNESWKCFIFTLGSVDNKWRQLDDITHQIQPRQGACLNGVVHWVIEDVYDQSPDGILAFSFEDEKCRRLPLPNCEVWDSYVSLYGLYSTFVYLKALGGQLRLVITVDGSNAGFWGLWFWTLTDYTKRVWTFDYYVKFPILDASMIVHLPVPVEVQNDKVLLSSGSRLYLHDVKRMTSTEINCSSPGEDPLNNAKCFQPNHVESLVTVYGKY